MVKKQLSPQISIIKSTVLFLFAVVCAFFLIMSVGRLTRKYLTVRNDITELRAQHQKLSEKLQTLTDKNAYLETAEGQERELRTKFAMVKPGESVIVIAGTTPAEPASQPSSVARFWDSIVRGLGFRK